MAATGSPKSSILAGLDHGVNPQINLLDALRDWICLKQDNVSPDQYKKLMKLVHGMSYSELRTLIDKAWIILDTGSTGTLFSNESLVNNIWKQIPLVLVNISPVLQCMFKRVLV